MNWKFLPAEIPYFLLLTLEQYCHAVPAVVCIHDLNKK